MSNLFCEKTAYSTIFLPFLHILSPHVAHYLSKGGTKSVRSLWKPALLVFAISVLVACVILFVIVRFFMPSPQDEEGRFKPQYVIADWEGRVAVFEGDDSYPMQVYDTFVSTLPEELQQNLQQGVPVENDSRLSVLLEDYTG